ncbi:hypothetical protein BOX15_Mlig000915g1 [Macrostomum lignano]|uniref:Uncharacterized protein n=2 Tax=Macrostomum lignano TaxID=282301 RepID=A0A267GKR1_9PLAT|nr:hypothetical protein BOX15_Mlig000915g1 [Macrostomum lignano]
MISTKNSNAMPSSKGRRNSRTKEAIELGCSAAVLHRRVKNEPINATELQSARPDRRSFTVSCRLNVGDSSSSSSGCSGNGACLANWNQTQQQQQPPPPPPQPLQAFPLHLPLPPEDDGISMRQPSSSTDFGAVPKWSDRLLLVLKPAELTQDDAGHQSPPQFVAHQSRQIFCVVFHLNLLAKLLGNLPTLKAIVNKTRCCVKLRDALMLRRLARTGCMVKYMLFSLESDAKWSTDACLRFLEDFDPAFSARRQWRCRVGSSGCPLVLLWNRSVPENTLLSMYGQRLMSMARCFCCSPVGPQTDWLLRREKPSQEEEPPEGLLG